jgi:hypothetical protein
MSAMRKRALALLDEWNELLGAYRQRSLDNCRRIRGGHGARVIEKDGRTLVMDTMTHRRQVGIQAELKQILPNHRRVILAKPDAPGEWSCKDYIDLYVGHYETVIQRLRLAVDVSLPE